MRRLSRSPGFTAAAILTLAIALAANITLFSVVDAVLLAPLPFEEPDRIVALWDSRPSHDIDKWRVSSENYLQWRQRDSGFEQMALFGASTATLTGHGDPLQLSGSAVRPEFFPMLGVEPLIGRLLEAGDFEPSAAPVIILSHSLWRRLGSDTGIIGRELDLDGESLVVAGVLPRQLMPLTAWASGRLELATNAEHYWVPMNPIKRNHAHVHGVLARLAPGVTLAEARARLETISLALERELPESNEGYRVKAVPLAEEAVGDVRMPLLTLMAAAGFVLLIACANVSHLFAARFAGRRKELAVRSALGATRLSLWRLFLDESLVIAAGGAAAGLILSAWALRLLPVLLPVAIPRLDEAALLDGRSLLIAGLLCAASGLAASLGPALMIRRGGVEKGLRESGRLAQAGSSSSRWTKQALVASETGLAVVLVIGSGLMLASFERLRSVHPGFTSSRVLALQLQLPQERYPAMHDLNGFQDELLEQIEALPGVVSAAASYDHPLTANWSSWFQVLDAPEPTPGEEPVALFRTVTPGYFSTVGIRLLRGRDFSPADDADSPGVAIVNEALARKYLRGEDPVGRRLAAGTTQWVWGEAIPDTFEIVGVAEDVRFSGLDAPSEPAYYIPYRQTPQHKISVFVRSAREPMTLVPEVRARLRAIDPGLPIVKVSSLDSLLSESLATPRFSASLLGIFAAGSLFLAMIGLWGVLDRSVRDRTHEIGVRMVLGARRQEIFVWVLRRGLAPALAGLAAGLAGAAALSRLMSGLLFEISPTEPSVYLLVAGVFLVVCIAACLLPARRATRTDPMIVLRGE